MEAVISPPPAEGPLPYDLPLLRSRVKEWTRRIQEAGTLAALPPPNESEPFTNVNKAIEQVSLLNFEVDAASNVDSVGEDKVLRFWVRFTKVHVLASLAKWYEICEELSVAEDHHVQCVELINKDLEEENGEELLEDLGDLSISESESNDKEEYKKGKQSLRYMYVYVLTRFAILCSQRDNQQKALQLLKKAETFYHDGDVKDNLPSSDPNSILGMLDSLASEQAKDMFTYVLFYLGQAYKIEGQKERAILYLHMVLRRQLEKGDYNCITWASDSSRMSSVLMGNPQALQTARNILTAATAVLKKTPKAERETDTYKENWADLGKTWAKLGVTLLEASEERLKDLEEEHPRKIIKFEVKMTFDKYEKKSLEIPEGQAEYDTILLIRNLKFPKLDLREEDKSEMKGKFVRDFEEAREVFLCAQHWINISKEYYTLEEYASDYIEIMTDYASLFKHLAFFEPNLDRQVKMKKRVITILEELLGGLNAKAYSDVFHTALRELAETYEAIYKLKVDECKEKGKSLRPKDNKLVQWVLDSVGAHKRNLELFGFQLEHPEKSFPAECEKILMAIVLSCGRMLGSLCHDHPLHPEAITLGEESKRFYKYFLEYLDRRIELKREFYSLYEGSQDMPELLDSQIRKIRNHHRFRSTMEQAEGNS